MSVKINENFSISKSFRYLPLKQLKSSAESFKTNLHKIGMRMSGESSEILHLTQLARESAGAYACGAANTEGETRSSSLTLKPPKPNQQEQGNRFSSQLTDANYKLQLVSYSTS
ncbi:unnamed protein product [Ceratitis capitata]|uniref:(Mediterranean fruit fly) hypothetical protein n=1 Tax=Ceratitis capitata TaxID=7213 RepID=A0A811U935_CERCA|nr:unnamed protein product [Ceratitis capitata]